MFIVTQFSNKYTAVLVLPNQMQVRIAIEQHLSIMLKATYITTSFACEKFSWKIYLISVDSCEAHEKS